MRKIPPRPAMPPLTLHLMVLRTLLSVTCLPFTVISAESEPNEKYNTHKYQYKTDK